MVCDNMLQGLGRYLRCLGVDVRLLDNEDDHRKAAEVSSQLPCPWETQWGLLGSCTGAQAAGAAPWIPLSIPVLIPSSLGHPEHWQLESTGSCSGVQPWFSTSRREEGTGDCYDLTLTCVCLCHWHLGQLKS